MQIFYRADNARTGDVIPIYANNKFNLFYLKSWMNTSKEGVVPGWHRMETTDLINMGEETPIHVVGGTGDLIYYQGKWHLFACIFPDGRQYITHYVSKDGTLDHWIYIEEDTFGPDGVIYHCSDWRDPRIFYREDLQEYWMIMAARKNDVHTQTGCVGLCVSKDLKKWEYREPLYYPARFNGACECPDIFSIGDWYYLVFSSYTTLFGNYYVKCKKGDNTWKIPVNHRMDGRGFYAAKTVSDGKKRYLIGWSPTKEENIFGFWPDKFKGQDYHTWDWGGDMIVHELGQNQSGDLILKIPETRRNLLQKEIPLIWEKLSGEWAVEGNKYTSTMKSTQNTIVGSKLPSRFYLNLDLDMGSSTEAGVILQTNEKLENGYYLYLEPYNKRLVFRSWIRMYEEGGKTFPYDVEMETVVENSIDGHYSIEILAEDTTAVIYINNEAALSFRMYDFKEGNLGLFALGEAQFSNISLRTE